MKRIILQSSVSVLLFSLLIYLIGRVILPNLISDDTGDWFLWSGGISIVVILFLRINNVQKIRLEIRNSINVGIGSVIFFLACFGLWGLFSDEGNHIYQEMSGLIPYYSLVMAGLLLLILLILNLVWKRSSLKQK